MTPPETPLSRREWTWLAALVALAAALRAFTLGARSLWQDEVLQVSFYRTSDSLLALAENAAIQSQPPLDYVIGYLLHGAFGFSEWLVRFPAFLFGTLLLIPLYLLTRRAFSVDVALITTAMAALSPWLVRLSQEARPYSLLFFLLYLSLYRWLVALERHRRRDWVILGICVLLMLNSRGFVPLVAVLVMGLVGIWASLLDRDRPAWNGIGRVKAMVVTGAVAGLLFLPQLYLLFVGTQSHSYIGVGTSVTEFLAGVFYTRLHYYNVTEPFVYPFMALFTGGVGIALFAPLADWRTRALTLVAVAMPTVQILVYHGAVDVSRAPFANKYLIHWLPLLFAVSAHALVTLAGRITRRPGWRRGLIALTCAPFLLGFAYQTGLYYFEEKDDWRGVAAYVATHAGPDDVIWVETPAPYERYGGYQARFEGKPVYTPAIPDLTTDELAALLKAEPERPGNLFFVQYGGSRQAQGERDGFRMPYFHRLLVVHTPEPSERLRDNVAELLKVVTPLYPEDSSRVRPLLMAARLAELEGNPERAAALLEQAAERVPEGYRERWRAHRDSVFPADPSIPD